MSDEKNSPASRTGYQDSKHESISGNSGNIANAKIEERIGLLFAVAALIVSAMTATYVLVKVDNLRDQAIKTDTECSVLNDEVHEIKGALSVK